MPWPSVVMPSHQPHLPHANPENPRPPPPAPGFMGCWRAPSLLIVVKDEPRSDNNPSYSKGDGIAALEQIEVISHSGIFLRRERVFSR